MCDNTKTVGDCERMVREGFFTLIGGYNYTDGTRVFEYPQVIAEHWEAIQNFIEDGWDIQYSFTHGGFTFKHEDLGEFEVYHLSDLSMDGGYAEGVYYGRSNCDDCGDFILDEDDNPDSEYCEYCRDMYEEGEE